MILFVTFSVPYICQVNSDVCKLRIDYDTMVLTAPFSTTSSSVATDSTQTGDCQGCIFYLGLQGVYILPTFTYPKDCKQFNAVQVQCRWESL